MKLTPQKTYSEKFKKIPMSSDDFKTWMQENNLTIPDVCMYLGLGFGSVTKYCNGSSKIPHSVKLACELYGLQHA